MLIINRFAGLSAKAAGVSMLLPWHVPCFPTDGRNFVKIRKERKPHAEVDKFP
jgi:hypothetical protein